MPQHAMPLRRRLYAAVALILSTSLLSAQNYKVTGSIPVGGAGAWDYVTADAEAHLLYVSHGTEVTIIDTSSNKVTGKIEGMKRIHGIALDKAKNIGFISDGGSNEVVIFDLKTLAVTKKVAAGTNPDGIVYDGVSHRVFAFNGGTKDATAIDAATGQVAGTIALGGKPEFPVADGHGFVYDNIEDKNEIVRIDAKALTVKAHWPVAPCESPSGLAIDREKRRLFAVCNNKMMAIVDANTGKVLATPAIGEGPDAAAFDPASKLIFSSNGSGTVTVIRESKKNQFTVVQTVPTQNRSRTMTVDTATHKLYLPGAEFAAAPKPATGEPARRPTAVPDTFKILVLETTR